MKCVLLTTLILLAVLLPRGCSVADTQTLTVRPDALTFSFSTEDTPVSLNQTVAITNHGNNTVPIWVIISAVQPTVLGLGAVLIVQGFSTLGTSIPIPLAPNMTETVVVQVRASAASSAIPAGNYTCRVDITTESGMFSKHVAKIPVTIAVTPARPKPPTPASTVQQVLESVSYIPLYAAASAGYVILILSIAAGRLVLTTPFTKRKGGSSG